MFVYCLSGQIKIIVGLLVDMVEGFHVPGTMVVALLEELPSSGFHDKYNLAVEGRWTSSKDCKPVMLPESVME